jgi:hypothetical protein
MKRGTVGVMIAVADVSGSSSLDIFYIMHVLQYSSVGLTSTSFVVYFKVSS